MIVKTAEELAREWLETPIGECPSEIEQVKDLTRLLVSYGERVRADALEEAADAVCPRCMRNEPRDDNGQHYEHDINTDHVYYRSCAADEIHALATTTKTTTKGEP